MAVNLDSVQKINGVNYYIDAIKNHYVDFNGRAGLGAFWYFALFNLCATVILAVVDAVIAFIIGVPFLVAIYSLAVALPGLGLSVRRLHDIDKSGWWVLVSIVPLVSLLYLIYLFTLAGTSGSNRFGANPQGK